MGEVYRARDTTLKREVALKVLPATFLRDPDSVPRQLNVILNWSDELERPAAAGNK